MLKNRVLWAVLLAPIVYVVLSLTIDWKVLRLNFASQAWTISVVVVATWFREVRNIIRRDDYRPRAIFVLGVWFTWLILFFRGVVALVSLILDQPDWLTRGPIPGFIAYTIVLVGIVQILAVGKTKGAKEGAWKWHLAVGLGSGFLLTAVVATFYLA